MVSDAKKGDGEFDFLFPKLSLKLIYSYLLPFLVSFKVNFILLFKGKISARSNQAHNELFFPSRLRAFVFHPGSP
jgi:hypothetical protein